MKHLSLVLACALLFTACDHSTTAPAALSGGNPFANPLFVGPLQKAGVSLPRTFRPEDVSLSTCAGNCATQVFQPVYPYDGGLAPVPNVIVYAIWDLAHGGFGASISGCGYCGTGPTSAISIPAGVTSVWILADAYDFTTTPFTIWALYNQPTYALSSVNQILMACIQGPECS